MKSLCVVKSLISTKESKTGISTRRGSLFETASKDVEGDDRSNERASIEALSKALRTENLVDKVWLNSLKLWSKVTRSTVGLVIPTLLETEATDFLLAIGPIYLEYYE